MLLGVRLIGVSNCKYLIQHTVEIIRKLYYICFRILISCNELDMIRA